MAAQHPQWSKGLGSTWSWILLGEKTWICAHIRILRQNSIEAQTPHLRGSVLFPWLHISARTQCTIVPGDAVSPTGLESCKHQIYCLRDKSLEQAASCQTVQGDCGAIPSTPLPYRFPVSFILRSK